MTLRDAPFEVAQEGDPRHGLGRGLYSAEGGDDSAGNSTDGTPVAGAEPSSCTSRAGRGRNGRDPLRCRCVRFTVTAQGLTRGWSMRIPQSLEARRASWASSGSGGHDHFWQRAISRRAFMRGSAAATGVALAARTMPFMAAAAAPASAPAARPIPGGFNLADFGGPDLFLHVNPPAPGFELITVTDFNGAFGAAEIRGLGTDTDGQTRAFDVDMRFMQGEYIGEGGRHAEATFGFI